MKFSPEVFVENARALQQHELGRRSLLRGYNEPKNEKAAKSSGHPFFIGSNLYSYLCAGAYQQNVRLPVKDYTASHDFWRANLLWIKKTNSLKISDNALDVLATIFEGLDNVARYSTNIERK